MDWRKLVILRSLGFIATYMINGGYYIKARKIQESEIAHAAPSVREIWDWLLQQANHKTNKVCDRGQCVRTYKDIMDGLSWYAGWRKMTYSKSDCENAMKFLRSRLMITTQKTTRGLVITIVNYDLYQNPKSYESHTEYSTEYHSLPQHTATINKNDKNDKNVNKHIPSVSFDLFWGLYPKKVERKKAEEKWGRLSEEIRKVILEDIPKRKLGLQWQRGYVPNPTTYFNGERWNDQIEAVSVTTGSLILN